MQEWLNWPLSKSGESQDSEGSNPSLSAKKEGNMATNKTEQVQPAPEKHDENTLAIVSMVLGVVSLTGPGLLLGIPAIITASIALKQKQGSRGLSLTGLITGIISTVVSLLFIAFMILLVMWSVANPDDTHEPYRHPTQSKQRFDSSRT